MLVSDYICGLSVLQLHKPESYIVEVLEHLFDMAASHHAHKAVLVELLREQLYTCAIEGHVDCAGGLCTQCMDMVFVNLKKTDTSRSFDSKRAKTELAMVEMLMGANTPAEGSIATALKPGIVELVTNLKQQIKLNADQQYEGGVIPDVSFSSWSLPKAEGKSADEFQAVGVQVGLHEFWLWVQAVFPLLTPCIVADLSRSHQVCCQHTDRSCM